MPRKPKPPKQVGTLSYGKQVRRNIPTAEMADLAAMQEELEPSRPARYPRARPLAEGETRERNEDLDPQIVWNGATITLTKDQVAQLAETGSIEIGDAQLVWRGKDRQDWSDLVVTAPPLYIQEKVHPKAIIDDLVRRTKEAREEDSDAPDLFADFNGIDDPMARTEFYRHDQHWSNRMILGDSLQVMASLAEREALKGKVQAVYFDPPYGIKFGSNWQVSTQSRDVKDTKQADVSREPEQVKAFRDTWKDGIHSYLTYLRDRLMVMRELLSESGSLFVQIGDKNVHRVRGILDEVFGEQNRVVDIVFKKKSSTSPTDPVNDYIVWYAKDRKNLKVRQLFEKRRDPGDGSKMTALVQPQGKVLQRSDYKDHEIEKLLEAGAKWARVDYPVVSQHPSKTRSADFAFQGIDRTCGVNKQWRFGLEEQMPRLAKAQRLFSGKGKSIGGIMYWSDWDHQSFSNIWEDIHSENFPVYVVQTSARAVERCLLMATDPGDLVLDPTCGSGTTAYVAEQWGRRWVTIDTSRVALALARTRIMSARYPWYHLADSAEGKQKEAEVAGKTPPDTPSYHDVRQGFIYERAQRVTLKSIANNAEIDVIWENWQEKLEPLREELNEITGEDWEEWEIPREPGENWSSNVLGVHSAWWDARIARQKEIDASIQRGSDFEYLYDKPYTDPNRVRVAGPFTVESLSPHRIVPADEAEGMEGSAKKRRAPPSSETDFAAMVIEHLKTAGVHQTDKDDRITFTSLLPFAGRGYIGVEGLFMEGETERRAAIFIGPEFGTLSRVELTAAAREAAESRFDVLIAVSFAFDAHASELARLGPLPILKARMNPDLHMAGELKNTGKGNLFTVFGEPDIDILEEDDGRIAVRVNGVDIYDPNTGDVRSSDVKGIATWFIDTSYNEESFFVRHAYFLGAKNPYRQLKTTLKAEIDEEAWSTLNRHVSRPFERPKSGRIAVKVINHFGDEVMQVFEV